MIAISDKYQIGAIDSSSSETLGESLNAELEKIQQQLKTNMEYIVGDVNYVEVEKPQPLQMFFADGTNWDPGLGKGVYIYLPSFDSEGNITSSQWAKIDLTLVP